jgi:hypothetical protein
MRYCIPIVILLFLLVSCAKQEYSYKLIADDFGVKVQNNGSDTAKMVSVDFDVFWYANVQNGTNEENIRFQNDFSQAILPAQERMVAPLEVCVPADVVAQEAFNIFRVVLTLNVEGNQMDQQTIYVYFGEGKEPCKYELYLLSEKDYIGVRDYVVSEYQKLQGKI